MKYVDHRRRHSLQCLGTLALLGGFGAPALGAERDGTTKTLRLIVSAPSGSTPDIVARHYADRFGAPRPGGKGDNVVVENRPGAGGMVAIGALRQAPPDGSTMLLIGAGAVTMYPHLHRRLSYDPVHDLVPVSLAARLSYGLGVGPAVPEGVGDLDQLLA
jgi:tripartite-type tricarboxylate transporter receptor subunit TctC